jgi:hypothetical protein
MPSVVVDVTNFPTLATITNLVRSDVRDDMAGATNTLGEGQILVDNISISVTMMNFFNSAVRELCRQLRIQQAPMLIIDNYIIANVPPLNGPMGLAVADPSVQVAFGSNGYFDGTLWHNGLGLPTGVYQVIRCWERRNASNDTFSDMGEPANGMAGIYQTCGWGRWEWRQNMVWTPGSLDNRDLRIRFLLTLNAPFVPNADPTTTYLPIMDCEEAIARKIGRMYARRQGGGMYQIALQEEQQATKMFLNEENKKQQGQEYQPMIYGSETPPVLNYGQ